MAEASARSLFALGATEGLCRHEPSDRVIRWYHQNRGDEPFKYTATPPATTSNWCHSAAVAPWVNEINIRAGLGGGEGLLAGRLQDRDIVMVPQTRDADWAKMAAIPFGVSTTYRNVTD